MERLDKARHLQRVKSWREARIERKWVEGLKLDAEQLGLEVVDGLPDDADLEPDRDLPDVADREWENALPDEATR